MKQLAALLTQFGDDAPVRKKTWIVWPVIYWDRGQLARLLGDYQQAEADEETAQIIDP
jgi:hypothetical protein